MDCGGTVPDVDALPSFDVLRLVRDVAAAIDSNCLQVPGSGGEDGERRIGWGEERRGGGTEGSNCEGKEERRGRGAERRRDRGDERRG